MKKSIFCIILIVLFSSIAPEAKSETTVKNSSTGLIHLFLSKNDNSSAQNKRVKKRKIKKVVRKVARVYRQGKTDRSKIKKSRKIQRQARRIINIF